MNGTSTCASWSPSTADGREAGPRSTCLPASPEDADALERLAQLDGVRLPREPLLLAEVDDKLHAALSLSLSLSDGRVLADPFHGRQLPQA